MSTNDPLTNKLNPTTSSTLTIRVIKNFEYRTVKNTLKIYTKAHGFKNQNLVINTDHDEWLLNNENETLISYDIDCCVSDVLPFLINLKLGCGKNKDAVVKENVELEQRGCNKIKVKTNMGSIDLTKLSIKDPPQISITTKNYRRKINNRKILEQCDFATEEDARDHLPRGDYGGNFLNIGEALTGLFK
ncbi:7780_t:CDS:2 [Entrophospora sp. SA101]|nr:3425_t:CDS:2 [Entrophospora sp. SA101]CAJ0829692.1 7780_t:CDS:2 [Entrophospora sp. SA101]